MLMANNTNLFIVNAIDLSINFKRSSHVYYVFETGVLRLIDGSHSKEGRLEIFHSGIWGSVCDDIFGQPDATVACKQLGFRYVMNSKCILQQQKNTKSN